MNPMKKFLITAAVLVFSSHMATAAPKCGDAAVLETVAYLNLGGDKSWSHYGVHDLHGLQSVSGDAIKAYFQQVYQKLQNPGVRLLAPIIPILEKIAAESEIAVKTEIVDVSHGVPIGYDETSKTYQCQANITRNPASFIRSMRSAYVNSLVGGMGSNAAMALAIVPEPKFMEMVDQVLELMRPCFGPTINYFVNDDGYVVLADASDDACFASVKPQQQALVAGLMMNLRK